MRARAKPSNRATERATRKVPKKLKGLAADLSAKVHRTTKLARDAAELLEGAKEEVKALNAALVAVGLERDAALNELVAVRAALGTKPGQSTVEHARALVAGPTVEEDPRGQAEASGALAAWVKRASGVGPL